MRPLILVLIALLSYLFNVAGLLAGLLITMGTSLSFQQKPAEVIIVGGWAWFPACIILPIIGFVLVVRERYTQGVLLSFLPLPLLSIWSYGWLMILLR